MLLRTKISFFILVLVLVSSFSGSYGMSKSAENDINPHFKVMPQATRKLLNSGVDVLDYRDPGANPGHDPGKGKGSPGGNH